MSAMMTMDLVWHGLVGNSVERSVQTIKVDPPRRPTAHPPRHVAATRNSVIQRLVWLEAAHERSVRVMTTIPKQLEPRFFVVVATPVRDHSTNGA